MILLILTVAGVALFGLLEWRIFRKPEFPVSTWAFGVMPCAGIVVKLFGNNPVGWFFALVVVAAEISALVTFYRHNNATE